MSSMELLAEAEVHEASSYIARATGRRDQRDRSGRTQDCSGRKQDRTGRKQDGVLTWETFTMQLIDPQ